jgi:hypothetical protein
LASANAAKDIANAFLDKARLTPSKELLQDYPELLKAFRDQMPKVVTALEDKDPALRQLSLRIVEDLATARTWLATNVPPPAPIPAPKPMTRGDVPRRPESLPDKLPVALPASQEKEAQPPADLSPLSPAVKVAIPALMKALRSSDVETRRSAALVLEAAGEDVAPYIADLARGLSDSDRFVRWTLLRTLGRLAPQEAKVVVPAVIRTVHDPDIDVRFAALKTLERFDKAAASAAPAIAELLPHADTLVQLAALKTIQAIGGGDASTLATVAGLLQSPEANVRVAAAETLGRAGKRAAATRPALESALKDEDDKVRTAASEALLRVK